MFGGFKLDVGGSAHFMIHHTPIVSDLELHKYGLEYIPLDPFMTAPFDDGSSISFYQDLDRTCENIARISEHDADAYYRFIPVAAAERGDLRGLSQAAVHAELRVDDPVPQVQRESGRSQRSAAASSFRATGGSSTRRSRTSGRAALAWWGAQSGPPPIDAVSAEFIGWHSVIHKKGPASPRGGSGMLTQALAAYIRDHGGEVLADHEVEEILVENGRAVGARTVAGDSSPRSGSSRTLTSGSPSSSC